MKTLVLLLTVLFVLPAYAGFSPASITFGIDSSAKTSTPNVKIGVMKGQLARDGNTAMQSMTVPDSIVNYYLTKTQAYSFAEPTKAIQIQVDQDTKMYVGSDLTNYLLLKSGVDYTYTVK